MFLDILFNKFDTQLQFLSWVHTFPSRLKLHNAEPFSIRYNGAVNPWKRTGSSSAAMPPWSSGLRGSCGSLELEGGRPSPALVPRSHGVQPAVNLWSPGHLIVRGQRGVVVDAGVSFQWSVLRRGTLDACWSQWCFSGRGEDNA